MNTLYLKYAVEVERTGSISQAAENLFMAQPNLSKAIKELENDLGIEIFERSSRGVRLTAQGEEFLKYAENILEQLGMMENISKENQQKDCELSLCIPYGCLSDKVILLLKNAREKMRLSLRADNTIQTINAVSDGRSRFGVIRYKSAFEEYFTDLLEEKKLQFLKWRRINGMFIFSEKSEHTSKITPETADFNAMNELFQDVRSLFVVNANKRQKYTGNTAFGDTAFEILSHCTDMYMRSAPIAAETLTRFGLIQRINPEETYTECLIYRMGYKLSQSDKLYTEQLYTAFTEIGTAL